MGERAKNASKNVLESMSHPTDHASSTVKIYEPYYGSCIAKGLRRNTTTMYKI